MKNIKFKKKKKKKKKLIKIDRENLVNRSQMPIYDNPVMIILFIIIINIIPNRDFIYSMNKQLDSQEYV